MKKVYVYGGLQVNLNVGFVVLNGWILLVRGVSGYEKRLNFLL